MSEVFLCQTGQLTAAARRQLREAGIVVVEVADPSTCQFIRSTETVSADDMLWAAVDALSFNGGSLASGGSAQRERLAFNLFKIVTESRKQQGQYVRPERPK